MSEATPAAYVKSSWTRMRVCLLHYTKTHRNCYPLSIPAHVVTSFADSGNKRRTHGWAAPAAVVPASMFAGRRPLGGLAMATGQSFNASLNAVAPRISTSFNDFQWVSMSFKESQRVSTSFNESQRVQTSFNEFQRVSTSLNEVQRASATIFNASDPSDGSTVKTYT